MEADLLYWDNAAEIIPSLNKMLEELCWTVLNYAMLTYAAWTQ